MVEILNCFCLRCNFEGSPRVHRQIILGFSQQKQRPLQQATLQ